jgi:hypothetical protein
MDRIAVVLLVRLGFNGILYLVRIGLGAFLFRPLPIHRLRTHIGNRTFDLGIDKDRGSRPSLTCFSLKMRYVSLRSVLALLLSRQDMLRHEVVDLHST